MNQSNKFSYPILDKKRTFNLILLSLFFNIYYFTFFKLHKKLQAKNTKTNNLDYLFINALQIKTFGSNHYRRRNIGLNFILKLISKLLFWKRIKNNSLICLLTKNPIKLYKADFILKKDQKINFNGQIIFCGDSHVEFLSRINFDISFEKKIKPISIWLGPRTLIGCASDKKTQNWVFEIIKRIKSFKNDKSIYIIFSLGSIDIRQSLGYLLKTESINSEKVFFDIFERSYIAFFEAILKGLKGQCKTKIAFLSLPPVSPLEGIDIKKTDQIKSFKNQIDQKFSIFGSPKERSLWAKAINLRLEKISKEKGWNFINNEKAYQNIELKNSYIFDKKFSFDNIHISNSKLYADTLENIISYFEDNK